MKKFLAVAVAMLLLTLTCTAVFAADPESYIWSKYDGTGAVSQFQIELRGDDLSFIKEGERYTAFANVWFSEDCAGNGSVYANYYAYAEDTNGVYANLNSFQDFAKSSEAGENLGKWALYTSNSFAPGEKVYDGSNPDAGCKLITLGMGFWDATGEVRVANIGIKDSDGNIVFERKFDTALAEDEGLITNMTAENKGTTWGIVGEKVVETPDVSDNGEDNPKTGDATMVFALIALVSVAGAVVVSKKRG